MNKKLGPGMLLILSLILLYLGGVTGGAIGAGLSAGGFVCLIAGIIGAIKALIAKGMKSDNRNVTINNAETLANRYRELKQRHSMDDTAYIKLIDEATGTEEHTKSIYMFATENAKRAGEKRSLKWIIVAILVAQYADAKGKQPTHNEMMDILKQVEKVTA